MQREGRQVTGFRALLVAIWLVIAAYTTIVVASHGLGFLPVFFGDMARMGWPGQFNLDFLCMLALSGLWVAWRHRFTAAGLGLGLLALFGGAFFLSAYLLLVSLRERGDMARILLGADHDAA